MKTTGKAREALSEWLKTSDDFYNTTVEHLEEYPECMQFGVYVDFFDSVGIYLNAIAFERMKYFKAIVDGNMEKRKFKNRNDALIFAINKAVEIFNERH